MVRNRLGHTAECFRPEGMHAVCLQRSHTDWSLWLWITVNIVNIQDLNIHIFAMCSTDLLHSQMPGLKNPDMPIKSCTLFQFITCSIVIGGLCCFGLAGNVTSFFVLYKHKTETCAMFLLQCLAISDSLLLVAVLFVYSFPAVHFYTGAFAVFDSGCSYIKTYVWPLAMMMHTTTIWLTVLVTFNRYCAVCRPIGVLRYYSVKMTKAAVMIVLSFSILYNSPRFFEHRAIHEDYQLGDNNTNVTRIETNLGDSRLYQIIYSNILYFPVMYILPLASLSYLNWRLIRGLHRLRSRKEMLTGHRVKQDNVTVCIIVIVFVFILCQTPALINQIFWAALAERYRECGHFHFYYTKISDVLVVFNSSANFVIYVLFSKSFRKIFLGGLCSIGGSKEGTKREDGVQMRVLWRTSCSCECMYDSLMSWHNVITTCDDVICWTGYSPNVCLDITVT